MMLASSGHSIRSQVLSFSIWVSSSSIATFHFSTSSPLMASSANGWSSEMADMAVCTASWNQSDPVSFGSNSTPPGSRLSHWVRWAPPAAAQHFPLPYRLSLNWGRPANKFQHALVGFSTSSGSFGAGGVGFVGWDA